MSIGNIQEQDGADYDTVFQSYSEALRRAEQLQHRKLQVLSMTLSKLDSDFCNVMCLCRNFFCQVASREMRIGFLVMMSNV